jgi:hypothetical protein
MFLGGHAQAASLGELNFLGKALSLREACSCGTALSECNEWRKVFDSVRSDKGFSPVDDPYRLRLWDARSRVLIDTSHQTPLFHAAFYFRRAWLGVRESLPHVAQKFVPIPPVLRRALANKMYLYQTIGEQWRKTHVIDSSKNPWEAMELARRWPDRVKVVLVTRNGRGVYLSRRGSGFSRRVSVSEWMNYYRRALPVLERNVSTEQLHRMSYEDFARDPEAAGRALCDFVGLDFDPTMLSLSAAGRHMANGNDTRFNPQKGIRLDERWRTELTGEELEYFNTHGAAINRMLGYE